MSRPLEEITGKNAHFKWSPSRQIVFEKLRDSLLHAPVLRFTDVNKPFRVETDASDFAIAGVLLQEGDSENDLHPVVYASWKLSAAEQNYTAAERETVAVVRALTC